ncbi:hypothetical protein BGX21_009209 [Mortierella sp. AD011]|nr:hypothetical protein BGX20_004022 [Mortierella sp. AD010]KAF9403843.1 hypothetical protein BGX21_009209 [Mortierella sp. AD011]
MKFTTTLLAATATLAAFVNADMLQINNPTAGTVWTAGVSNFVGWSGNCASMGTSAKNVTVILNTGPSEAVRYVATLGTLDCSGTNTRTDLTVPLTIPSGTYSIVVRTDPELSYTNMFTIKNPSDTASVTPSATVSGTSETPSVVPHAAAVANSAEGVKANTVLAGLGAMVFAAASQFLL